MIPGWIAEPTGSPISSLEMPVRVGTIEQGSGDFAGLWPVTTVELVEGNADALVETGDGTLITLVQQEVGAFVLLDRIELTDNPYGFEDCADEAAGAWDECHAPEGGWADDVVPPATGFVDC